MAPMKRTLAPSVTNRDPKGRKFMDIVAAAYDKAGLSDPEAQNVNNASGLADHIADFIAKNRTREEFANEETSSSYGYLSGYKPKDLAGQINRLCELFPEILVSSRTLLVRSDTMRSAGLPKNAEGWFAIPNWMKNPNIFGTTYSEAVQKVLDTINTARKGKFENYRKGLVDESHIRQSARSVEFWKQIAETQGNPDILIVPAQFGLRHRGRSVRRAHVVMEDTQGEVGLGAFAVGIMILTHPERLQNVDDLWIDCAGDEFDAPGSDGRFDSAPYFNFNDDAVGFGAGWVSGIRGDCGSASAFLPQ
jgi:hypothetical protein